MDVINKTMDNVQHGYFSCEDIKKVVQTVRGYNHDYDHDWQIIMKDGTSYIFTGDCEISFERKFDLTYLRIDGL